MLSIHSTVSNNKPFSLLLVHNSTLVLVHNSTLVSIMQQCANCTRTQANEIKLSLCFLTEHHTMKV